MNIDIQGHIKIINNDTQEILVDKSNAIHFSNMDMAIANLLGNQGLHHVASMRFGDGGEDKPTNTNDTGAKLYNENNKQTIGEDKNTVRVDDASIIFEVNLPKVDNGGVIIGKINEMGLYSADDNLLTHVIFNGVEKLAFDSIKITYTLSIKTGLQN